MKDTIIVKIDEDLEDIVPDFLRNRQKDVSAIEGFLNGKDFEAIRRIGHSMKGAGASYGFDFISETGKAIETAAKDRAARTIDKKKTELSHFLDRVRIEFIRE